MTDDVEQLVEQLAERVDELEGELQEEREERRELQEENEDLRDRVDELEEQTEQHDGRLEAIGTKAESNLGRIRELQSRELEKGAHLREENVYVPEIDVSAGQLERFEKSEGTHIRVPNGDDPLDRGGKTQLATADLLPIQQLARLDDEILASKQRPRELAARVWRTRDHGDLGPWKSGSGSIRHYLDAGALKSWIRGREDGISDAYANKLVSRVIDQLVELSQNRLGVNRRSRRTDGLAYRERRVVLTTAADVPGETVVDADVDADAPRTDVVHGD